MFNTIRELGLISATILVGLTVLAAVCTLSAVVDVIGG